MGLLWAVVVLLLVLWVAGLVLNLLGPFIHILLLIAAVVIVVNFFTGRRVV